ncbi:hypothetical protein POPTR_009G077700v4 [Populus trichocarpa]|uniref:Uncharacterized protein n=1 Tax=Populus trichocarpa TaxID=3694 RepID=B9HN92_POPTR|nr:uncharacterized protein LOC7478783 [Populus trichocarpa]KAI5576772.1 hypothetical protein BDE02_09G067600 [Populus trichocarpa]PNT20180.1 hypothetical protein POPTR_009G077700v4 [Populus trichocarpa]|eukprot:XP_002313964.1 uncharacterized protein LOC7478783 [Populus trichocarpa]
MNATPFSPPDLLQDNNSESDTETNPDDTPEYYQPISAVDYDDSHSDQSNSDEEHHNNPHFSDYHQHHLDNGHCARQAEDGISTLNLNEDVEGKSSSSEDGDEEELEEERVGEESETAILRAFREDESRRNAPLTPENATRVMEAMRGVSLGSFVPDWAGGVGGEQWIDELRRLRQPPGAGNQPSFQN